MLATIELILLIISSYLLGSVPIAYLAAKWSRGIDIRQFGSGNVGASNLLRITPKWVAILAIIFDLGKGMVFIWVAQLLGMGIVPQIIIGLAAIIGHNWPVFLGFSGGRGILTTLGVTFMLSPWLAVIGLVLAFGSLPLGYMATGVLFALIIFPIASWFFSQPLGITEPIPVTLGFLAMLLIAIIRRLSAPTTALATTVSRSELLMNRLLFDRDIRDRKEWVSRQPPEATPTNKATPPEDEQAKG